MKKALKTIIMAAFFGVMTLALSSCEKDNGNIYYSYYANGSLRASGSGANAADAAAAQLAAGQYNSAILSIVGEANMSTKEVDSKIISACDAVYQKHISTYKTWEGTVTITKNTLDINSENTSGKDTVLKTYTYTATAK